MPAWKVWNHPFTYYFSLWFHVASQYVVFVLKTSLNIWSVVSPSSCHHSADFSPLIILMILLSSTFIGRATDG
jgi:hypothetical protein